MSGLIFSASQVAGIRQGRIRAALVLRSEEELLQPGRPELWRLRPFRRDRVSWTPDRLALRRRDCEETEPTRARAVLAYLDDPIDADLGRGRSARVNDVGDGGELVPAVLTVLAVEPVDVYATDGEQRLTLEIAIACGYRTTQALRDAWRSRHPRTPLAHVVSFGFGDLRDKPRFLTSTRAMVAGRIGDYTSNLGIAIDDAEALTEVEYAALSASNRQKDVRRDATRAAALAAVPIEERVAAIERAGDEVAALVRDELRAIEERTVRAERKLAASG